jgi:transcription initiation factor IIE alpha subunit
MSKQSDILQFRKEQLRRQVNQALDLLQGSLHKNPSQRGYHLTTKVDQKTVTRYVRQALVPQVRAMTGNHRKVRKLLQRLSEANWRLLQLPPD